MFGEKCEVFFENSPIFFRGLYKRGLISDVRGLFKRSGFRSEESV